MSNPAADVVVVTYFPGDTITSFLQSVVGPTRWRASQSSTTPPTTMWQSGPPPRRRSPSSPPVATAATAQARTWAPPAEAPTGSSSPMPTSSSAPARSRPWWPWANPTRASAPSARACAKSTAPRIPRRGRCPPSCLARVTRSLARCGPGTRGASGTGSTCTRWAARSRPGGSRARASWCVARHGRPWADSTRATSCSSRTSSWDAASARRATGACGRPRPR